MRKRGLWIVMLVGTLGIAGTAIYASHFDWRVRAFLNGYDEVPAISTGGHGEFRARIRANAIDYQLSYDGLEGGAVLAAHIHLGRRGTNGGVSAFLCGGGDKPMCPESGTVTGTIDAEDVIGPESQGIAAEEFGELVFAMLSGATYVNVHTDTYRSGEIRGQIDDRR